MHPRSRATALHGDVRLSSTERVATAVGDGALVIRLVRQALDAADDAPSRR